MKDYYYILGVDNHSTLKEIKTAFKKLSKKFHPDINPEDNFFLKRFQDINEAYETLSDSQKRKYYDKKYKKAFADKAKSIPEVSIEVSKLVVFLNEPVSIKWDSKNCTQVSINLFGSVSPKGQKSIKFKNPHERIKIEIVGENSIDSFSKSLFIQVAEKDPSSQLKVSKQSPKRTRLFSSIRYTTIFLSILLLIYLVPIWNIKYKYDNDYGNYRDGFFSEGLIAIKQNGSWGYANKFGSLVIWPSFDFADNFSDGMGRVISKNYKHGFIDHSGVIVIPMIYDMAWNFNEGLAAVSKNGKWGFINKRGETVIPFKFQDADGFRNGCSLVMVNGQIGFCDREGEIVIPCKYNNARYIRGVFDNVIKIELDYNGGKEYLDQNYNYLSN